MHHLICRSTIVTHYVRVPFLEVGVRTVGVYEDAACCRDGPKLEE
jgi:hypothetical protein